MNFEEENKKEMKRREEEKRVETAKKFLNSYKKSFKRAAIGNATDEDYANLGGGSYYNDTNGSFTTYDKSADEYKTFYSPKSKYNPFTSADYGNNYVPLNRDYNILSSEPDKRISIYDELLNKYKNLPERKWSGIPSIGNIDKPDLEDKLDYNSNFQINPYKSVNEWRDDSGIAYMAEINPYWAAGMGLANQVANPYKQRYFEGRADENLVEEARRAQEELRYNREKEKDRRRTELQEKKYNMDLAEDKRRVDNELLQNTYNDLRSDTERKDAEAIINKEADFALKKAEIENEKTTLDSAKKLALESTLVKDETTWFISEADKTKIQQANNEFAASIQMAKTKDDVLAAMTSYNNKIQQIYQDADISLLPSSVLKNLNKGEPYNEYFLSDFDNAVAKLINWFRSAGGNSEALQKRNVQTTFYDNLSKLKDKADKENLLIVPLTGDAKQIAMNAPRGFVNRLANNHMLPNMFMATTDIDGNYVDIYVITTSGKLMNLAGTDIPNTLYKEKMSRREEQRKANE